MCRPLVKAYARAPNANPARISGMSRPHAGDGAQRRRAGHRLPWNPSPGFAPGAYPKGGNPFLQTGVDDVETPAI